VKVTGVSAHRSISIASAAASGMWKARLRLRVFFAGTGRKISQADGTLGFFDCDADRPDTDRTTSDIGRPAIEMLTSMAAVGAAIIGATEEAD
jgi:hypothetical protein